jgi:hypothetical protein
MFITKGLILYYKNKNNYFYNIPIKQWMITYSQNIHSTNFNDFNFNYLTNMIQINNIYYKIINSDDDYFTNIVLCYNSNNYYKIIFYKIKELNINNFIDISIIFKNTDITSIIYNLYTEFYIDKIIIANEHFSNWNTQIYYFYNNILSFISSRNNFHNINDFEEVYTDGFYITNYLHSNKIKNIPKKYTKNKIIPLLKDILNYL